MENHLEALHEKAVELAGQFKRCEAALIAIIQEIETNKVYLLKGHVSLYRYAVDELGLSDASALNFITVARKAKEIPGVVDALRSGTVTVSKVRKLTRVLTPENAADC